jgi:UDP-N-acetylmuramyl pentapeptide phosphotransferase/UDP-N-acetylglucosamine-1-phosphate transferase
MIVLVLTVFLATVGAIDDIHPLPVLPRLGLQAVAVIAVLSALLGRGQLFRFFPHEVGILCCCWQAYGS